MYIIVGDGSGHQYIIHKSNIDEWYKWVDELNSDEYDGDWEPPNYAKRIDGSLFILAYELDGDKNFGELVPLNDFNWQHFKTRAEELEKDTPLQAELKFYSNKITFLFSFRYDTVQCKKWYNNISYEEFFEHKAHHTLLIDHMFNTAKEKLLGDDK